MTARRLIMGKRIWLLSIVMVAASGCSSQLFKPVQPWYVGNATPGPQVQQPVPSEDLRKTNARATNVDPRISQVPVRPPTTQPAPPVDSPQIRQVKSGSQQAAEPVVLTADPGDSRVLKNSRTASQYDQFGRRLETEGTMPFRPDATSEGSSGNAKPISNDESSTSSQLQFNTPQFERSFHSSPRASEQKSPLYFGNGASTDGATKTMYRGQSPQEAGAVFIPTTFEDAGQVRPVAAQNPELQNSRIPFSPIQNPSIDIGGPNELNPFNPNYAPSGSGTFPLNYADLDIYVSETSTGRINFGGAYNSDSGLVGQFVIDERNFDLFRLPTSFRDIVDGTAWRGGGQNFRLELVPGSDVERYLVSFSEPFLGGTRISFSSSLYYFQRQFFDYDEERLGGRFAFGYRLTPDISVSTGIRMENVEISDPRNMTSPTLNGTLGDTDLYVANVGIIRDTRDHPFLPTEGNYLSATFSQGFGEFDYSRGDIDFRTYRLMYQRPDGSGRHTLSYGTKLGFSGSQTPIFENYFAGGFSTLRGFDFRAASPLEGDIRVGGEFQWLNTIEYMFPITADDMIKGVLFTDFGTVEENIEIDSENFRVAPGFGFRVHLPAAGIGAPLAFDFAFPVADAAGDEEQVFSFYLGVSR